MPSLASVLIVVFFTTYFAIRFKGGAAFEYTVCIIRNAKIVIPLDWTTLKTSVRVYSVFGVYSSGVNLTQY